LPEKGHIVVIIFILQKTIFTLQVMVNDVKFSVMNLQKTIFTIQVMVNDVKFSKLLIPRREGVGRERGGFY
jgi:tetrahydromethanopterin S-methyltransferase subunit F